MQKLRAITLADETTDAVMAATLGRNEIRAIIRQALEAYAIEALDPGMDSGLPLDQPSWAVSDHAGRLWHCQSRLQAVRQVKKLMTQAQEWQRPTLAILWHAHSHHSFRFCDVPLDGARP